MELLRTAKQIRKTEGLVALLRRGTSFLLGSIFEYRVYCLYRYVLENNRTIDEADIRPKVENITVKVVTTNAEADELEASGYEFRSYVANATRKLDCGAIACCIFVGKELAHIRWAATSQEAMVGIGEVPYTVDFEHKEAYGSGIWTNPRYRRSGFRVYGTFKIREYLLNNGMLIVKSAVDRRNTSSLMGSVKVGSEAYGESRYLKVLWWKSSREKPLVHASSIHQDR